MEYSIKDYLECLEKLNFNNIYYTEFGKRGYKYHFGLKSEDINYGKGTGWFSLEFILKRCPNIDFYINENLKKFIIELGSSPNKSDVQLGLIFLKTAIKNEILN